jgi:hypothetical protein
MNTRQIVWEKYIGCDKNYAACWVGCGRQFNIDFFVCYNVHNFNNINDIRPICCTCFKYVGYINIEQFKK